MKVKNIALDDLLEPEIPIRTIADEEKLLELVRSIREQGIIEPLVVSPEDDKFRIIAGHRRYLALRTMGQKDAPCVIREVDIYQRDMIRIHENVMREDVNPIDLAKYYEHVLRKHQITQSALADLIGKSDAHVSQVLSLIGIPEYLKEAVEQGQMSYLSAIELNKLPDESKRRFLTDIVVKDGASTEIVKGWVYEELVREGMRKERVAPPEETLPQVSTSPLMAVCFGCGRSSAKEPLTMIPVCVRCKIHMEDYKESSKGGRV